MFFGHSSCSRQFIKGSPFFSPHRSRQALTDSPASPFSCDPRRFLSSKVVIYPFFLNLCLPPLPLGRKIKPLLSSEKVSLPSFSPPFPIGIFIPLVHRKTTRPGPPPICGFFFLAMEPSRPPTFFRVGSSLRPGVHLSPPGDIPPPFCGILCFFPSFFWPVDAVRCSHFGWIITLHFIAPASADHVKASIFLPPWCLPIRPLVGFPSPLLMAPRFCFPLFLLSFLNFKQKKQSLYSLPKRDQLLTLPFPRLQAKVLSPTLGRILALVPQEGGNPPFPLIFCC